MRITHVLYAISLGLLTLTSAACVYNPPRHASVSYGVSTGYYEPWGYYYYPDVQVYFNYSSGYYYYPSGSIWVRTRFLPSYLHLNPRGRVQLHIESDKPYMFYRQHRQKYRSHPQYKPSPQFDRQEREHNHNRYQRQQRYQKKHRVAPPSVHTRPTPQSRQKHEVIQQHQQRIPFDAPQRHQPIPLTPKQGRGRAHPPEQKKGRTIERAVIFPGRQPQAPHGSAADTKPSRQGKPGTGHRQKSGPPVKKHKAKQKHSKQQKQGEDQSEQQGSENKRQKKERREEEQQRY